MEFYLIICAFKKGEGASEEHYVGGAALSFWCVCCTLPYTAHDSSFKYAAKECILYKNALI